MSSPGGSLFRQEVFDAKRSEWLAPVKLAMPLPYRLLAVASLLACIALFAFLIFGRYSRREQARGQLVPSLGLLAMTVPASGTLVRIAVHEGETVVQDQELFEISADLDGVSFGKMRAAVGKELRNQRDRTSKALDDQKLLATRKADALKVDVAALQRRLAQIDTQIALQLEQAGSAKALRRKFETLQNGVVSGIQIEQQKSAALAAEAEVAVLRRQRVEIEQQLAANHNQLLQLPLVVAAESLVLQKQISDLDQALAQNESQRAVAVRATQPGVVSNIVANSGDSVAIGQRILSIVPSGAQLQAELWLPSRAIGFISPGDRVVLRYEAFPYQKFGSQLGHVADVSRSASGAKELSVLLGRQVDEPAYRIIVRLNRQTISAYGKEESLRPGMMLQADILLDDRRLIDWVLEPIASLRNFASAGN